MTTLAAGPGTAGPGTADLLTGSPLTEGDRADLRDGARTTFAAQSTSARVRALMDTADGWERSEWVSLCASLGPAGLAVPEHLGGAGWSYAEQGVVFAEAGRVLLCAPLFSVAALAIPQLLASGDEAACARLLQSLLNGSVVATVAAHDPAGRHLGRTLPVCTEGTLTGELGFVTDGAAADLILVPATTPEGTGLFVVRRDDVTVTPLDTLDPTRKQAHVSLAAAPAELVGSPDAADRIEAGFDVARAMLACEQVGGADRCLELTTAYAKSRVQFGRPIGSFQIVKAKLADMLIAVESAKSASVAAAGASPELRSVTASVAHSFCSKAYTSAAAATIQLHGGIGFTWEHDAHLYYKRARTSEQLLGTPDEHLEQIAAHLEATLA